MASLIQSLNRAFDILEAVAASGEEGIGILRLAKDLHLKSSTTHNLMKTILARGYVEQEEGTRRYRLGRRCWHLLTGGFRLEEMGRIAGPFMARLSEKLREWLVLSAFREGRWQMVIKVECQQVLKVNEQFFEQGKAYASCTGRVLLAHLPDAAVRGYVKANGFPGESWDSIGGWEALQRALLRIRKDGYAVRKRDKDVVALAVPVKDPRRGDRAVAALGAIMPAYRCRGAQLKRVLTLLAGTAEEISGALPFYVCGEE